MTTKEVLENVQVFLRVTINVIKGTGPARRQPIDNSRYAAFKWSPAGVEKAAGEAPKGQWRTNKLYQTS